MTTTQRKSNFIWTGALTAMLLMGVTGCAKKEEAKAAPPRQNLTNSEEVAWANGDWQLKSTPDLGGQMRLSTAARTFKGDIVEDVSKYTETKLPKGTLCRFRLTTADLAIYRKDGTVYTLEARPTDVILVPAPFNSPACTVFIEGTKYKIARNELAFTIDFTKKTDEATGEVLLNNLTFGGSLYKKRSGSIKGLATCTNFTGAYAAEQDVRLDRQHVYQQTHCNGYSWLEKYAGAPKPPAYYPANNEWQTVEESTDRKIREKRRFLDDRLEVVRLEAKPLTQEETITTTLSRLNEWSDLVEDITVQKTNEAPRPSTVTRFRQAF